MLSSFVFFSYRHTHTYAHVCTYTLYMCVCTYICICTCLSWVNVHTHTICIWTGTHEDRHLIPKPRPSCGQTLWQPTGELLWELEEPSFIPHNRLILTPFTLKPLYCTLLHIWVGGGPRHGEGPKGWPALSDILNVLKAGCSMLSSLPPGCFLYAAVAFSPDAAWGSGNKGA